MTDVTYYVALPFTADELGEVSPGTAEEFQGPTHAMRRAEALARTPGVVGAVAFSRCGDPMIGEFKDATVLRSFGNVPSDLSGM
ncbi:MAG: hypothetical protein J0I29_12355 [Rhizobiales bacterium]|nr:hypothetical protein [Hyphomicrobiales bacterium]